MERPVASPEHYEDHRKQGIDVDSITKIAMGIVTVALVATVVVNASGSANVIKAAGGAFSGSLAAAEKG